MSEGAYWTVYSKKVSTLMEFANKKAESSLLWRKIAVGVWKTQSSCGDIYEIQKHKLI